MWQTRIMPQLKKETDITERELISKPLFASLRIYYAEDNGKTLKYITKQRLKELNMDMEELHKTALKNLNEDTNTITGYSILDHDDGTNAITYETNDTYDATRLLLLFYLKIDMFTEVLGDPFCVAIPYRDFLIAVPLKYEDKLKSYSKELFDKSKNKLLPDIFRFSKNGESFKDSN